MNGFLQGVWRRHDRRRLEVWAAAWGPYHELDDEKERGSMAGEAGVEHFVPLGGRSDMEVAAEVNRLRGDILVELVGWYPEQRSAIVAHRPCRVQALYRYIGPGGGRGDDFFVTDRISHPPELHAAALAAAAALLPPPVGGAEPWEAAWREGWAAERLALLPPPYLTASHADVFPREVLLQGQRRRRREAAGLPLDAPLAGALNKYYKICPATLDLWAEIMRRVPKAHLVLIRYRHFPEGPGHVTREMARRGVSAARVVTVGEGSPKEFVALGALLDVLLDTLAPLPNGHTAAADMLWSGLPVVTSPGPSKPSRVAAALALSAGCGATVARNTQEYVATAIRILRRAARYTNPRHSTTAASSSSFSSSSASTVSAASASSHTFSHADPDPEESPVVAGSGSGGIGGDSDGGEGEVAWTAGRCLGDGRVLDAGTFMAKWHRALAAMAEFPGHHILVHPP